MNKTEFNKLLSDTSTPIPLTVSSLLMSNLTINDIEPSNRSYLDDVVSYIFTHAEGYTAIQLHKLMQKGLFTLDLLLDKSQNLIDPAKRNQLRSLCGVTRASSGTVVGNDEIEWQQIDKKDRFILDDFVKRYPSSKHIPMAMDFLRGLRTDYNSLLRDYIRKGFATIGIYEYYSRGWLNKEELVKRLSEDKNLLSLNELKFLLDNNVLSIIDMKKVGFSDEIMKVFMGGKVDVKGSPILGPISQRVRVSEDFYFWGTSGSGKSCALGAIMSAANGCVPGCSMSIDYSCQGASYIDALKDVFKQNGKVGVLPPGTPVGVFAEMGFTLTEGRNCKPITCIDMAGGMLDILAKKEDSMGQTDKDVLANLVSLMTNAPKRNTCTHIFLLEYKPGDVTRQSDKLDKAIDKIKRLDLLKKTQEILVLVTKADKMNVPKAQLHKKANDYVLKEFAGFYNNLSLIAQRHNINNGEVRVMPFNIGNVEMQNYCVFEDEYAIDFVKKVFLRNNN